MPDEVVKRVNKGDAVEFRLVGLSDTGLVRSQNQDAIFLPDGQERQAPVFVLADGMGGASGGEVASDLAVETIPAAYAAALSDLGAEEALRRAVGQAATAIHRRAQEQTELKGMGTTTVALALVGERALLANVGDSRGYLWRQGRLMQVTQDHSLVQRLVADGSITPQEARHHHMRNVLTKVLGNAPSVEVDIFDLALMPGDRLLLCSDGLHGPVEDQEIDRVLASSDGLEEQARTLVELANGRGGPDNISVILVAIDSLGQDWIETTSRRTQVGVVTQTPDTPSPGPTKDKRKKPKLWLILVALIGLAGGLYLWSILLPASPTLVRGKVELAPLGPTTDSQEHRPAPGKAQGQEPAPAKEPRP